jgi:hypothetical protein
MADIAAWEAENTRLSEDYVQFLATYNGGTVYPMQFSTGLDEDIADEWDVPTDTGVDMLHDWATFVSVNARNDVRRKHMLQIGVDFESSSIGLAPDGRVVHLWRNFPGAWDEEDDGPLPVTVLAPDFRSFLLGLEDRDGTAPRWNVPRDLETAQQVTF